MKSKNSKQTPVRTARLLEHIEDILHNLTEAIVTCQDSENPVKKIEAAYYELLRRNFGRIMIDLGISAASYPRTITRDAIRSAVAAAVTENNVRRLSTTDTLVGQTACNCACERLHKEFQTFMP